jgi:hypothetical protein
MKHVKTYESFRNFKNTELQPINEELFGGVINFFKNLWKKTVDDMKKILGENPSPEKIEDFVDKNVLNPADDNYVFKGVIDEFNKKPEANEQDCLDLIKNILDIHYAIVDELPEFKEKEHTELKKYLIVLLMMQKKLLSIVALLLFSLLSVAQAPSKNVSRPKVVVGLVVDQMRWDYLYKFIARFILL